MYQEKCPLVWKAPSWQSFIEKEMTPLNPLVESTSIIYLPQIFIKQALILKEKQSDHCVFQFLLKFQCYVKTPRKKSVFVVAVKRTKKYGEYKSFSRLQFHFSTNKEFSSTAFSSSNVINNNLTQFSVLTDFLLIAELMFPNCSVPNIIFFLSHLYWRNCQAFSL